MSAAEVASALGLGGAGGDVEVSVEIDGLETMPSREASVHLEERVAGLPSCSVSLAIGPGMVEDVRDLFGKEATVSIRRGLSPARALRGIVRSGSMDPTRHGGQLLQLDLVPALWLLTQARDSRIYQDVTVPELVQQVVQELLGDRRYEVRLELTEDYPRHEYLVQHRESHLDFITRLMFEEGIWFTFDPDDDHEILVLSDANTNRRVFDNGLEGILQVTDGSLSFDERARPLRVRRSLGPSDVVVSGFDWTNPELGVQGEEPGGTGVPLEVHEHVNHTRHLTYDGSQYTAHTAGRQARLARERFALTRTSWSLDTNTVNLRAGDLFELVGDGERDGRYLVLSSRLHVNGRDVISSLIVVPEELPYRPPAPTRPTMPGPETATVVGPGGEEVHVDLHGRVKVQFHWDRRGQRDDRSSAWIRVAQMWAGGGHGSVFLPRVGTEVVVSYLGGDPDRPVILGSLYNGRNRPPADLPSHKLRSGFKTSRHELWLDDAENRVLLTTEGDVKETVRGGQTVEVTGAAQQTYGAGRSTSVSGGTTESISGGASTTISGGETRRVSGGSSVSVSGPSSSSCEGDVTSEVVGTATTRVTGTQATEVVGAVTREVRGAVTENLLGPLVQSVASVTQTVLGPLTMTASGDASITSTSAFHMVSSDATLTAHNAMSLVAQSIEATAESMSRTVQRDSLIAEEASVVATRLTSSVETEVAERGVQISRSRTSLSELGDRIERVARDIRQTDISCAVSNFLLIG